MSPVELAQRRMAEIEAHLPRIEPSAGRVDAADVAREAFAETGRTLQGLAHVWEGQRAARMKLGRHLLALQRVDTTDAAEELAGIVKDIPGAMQAAREAAASGDGLAP